jgi:stress response protein SCP2
MTVAGNKLCNKIFFSLRWERADYAEEREIDLDLSALLLAEDCRVLTDDFWVYYNNLSSPDHAALHFGDSVLFREVTAFENIQINFDYLNFQIKEIVFLANSYTEIIPSDLIIKVVIIDAVHLTVIEERALRPDVLQSGALEVCKLIKKDEKWAIRWFESFVPENISLILDKYI